MDIVFVCSYHPPYTVGGAEQSAHALARALRECGHRVRILTPLLGPEPPEDPDTETVDLGYRLERPGVAVRPGTFDRPATQARMARAIVAAARNADVVHVQTLDLLPSAWMATRRTSVPLVASIRDVSGICPIAVSLLDGPRVPPDCGMIKLQRECVPRFARLYETSRPRMHAAGVVRFASARGRSALLRRCDAVVSVGSDLGLVYADAGLLDLDKLVHIPNIAVPAGPIDGPPPEAVGNGPYAVYAGKVSLGKGMQHLLEATRLVRSEAPDFRLAIAGQATDTWAARVAGTEGAVGLGRISQPELRRLYAGARLAVVPSISPETFPRAAIEAAACGLPVVGTRAGGIPDAIDDGVTGLLVPPRDPAALAVALLELWQDQTLSRRMGEAGRTDVATRFSAERVTSEMVALYSRLAAGHPIAAR